MPTTCGRTLWQCLTFQYCKYLERRYDARVDTEPEFVFEAREHLACCNTWCHAVIAVLAVVCIITCPITITGARRGRPDVWLKTCDRQACAPVAIAFLVFSLLYASFWGIVVLRWFVVWLHGVFEDATADATLPAPPAATRTAARPVAKVWAARPVPRALPAPSAGVDYMRLPDSVPDAPSSAEVEMSTAIPMS